LHKCNSQCLKYPHPAIDSVDSISFTGVLDKNILFDEVTVMLIAGPCSPPTGKIERIAPEDLLSQITRFSETSLTRHLLDAIPTPLMVLNDRHQIVFANQGLLEVFAFSEVSEVHGLRPGEVFDCAFAKLSHGCGTSEACRTCDVLLASFAGLAGKEDERECQITCSKENRQEALDLRVKTSPITCSVGQFTVFTVSDISHEKRRRVLERIFFHDILNVAGSIRGFTDILLHHKPDDRHEIYALIQAAAEQTIEEIETQRILAAAENQELQIRPEPFHLKDFLLKTVGIYRRHQVAAGRELRLELKIPDLTLTSDRALLGRVLGNMIKNALEACAPNQTVTVHCSLAGNRILFGVHNPGIIPDQNRLKIFKRSFTTKGEGRGLGTYSLRLLSDHLRSEVHFTSSAEAGTTFFVLHPLSLNCPSVE
jgi:signal transduction histidine kinase